MDNKLFKRYSIIRQKMLLLAEQEANLKLQILETLETNNINKAETVFGKFTLSSKKNYKYSDRIKKLEEKIKMAKYEEQEKGIAKSSDTVFLTYTPNKLI